LHETLPRRSFFEPGSGGIGTASFSDMMWEEIP